MTITMLEMTYNSIIIIIIIWYLTTFLSTIYLHIIKGVTKENIFEALLEVSPLAL